MKKFIIYIFVFILLLFKEDNYTINNKYTIYYKKDYVKKVYIEKEIKSKNNTILDFFEKNVKDEFNSYNDKYGGYKISSSKDKNMITVHITFNIKDVDIDKFRSNNSYLRDHIKKNKLEIDCIYKLFSLNKNKCSK